MSMVKHLKATIQKLITTLKVVFHSVENIVRKGENAGYQHFLLFPQCFQKAFYLGAGGGRQNSSLWVKGSGRCIRKGPDNSGTLFSLEMTPWTNQSVNFPRNPDTKIYNFYKWQRQSPSFAVELLWLACVALSVV